MARLPLAPAILACLLFSCGGREPLPYCDGPVNIAYEMEGEVEQLSALRGRPVVLVLLRLNELTSELFIDAVVEAHGRMAGKIRFVVLTMDTNEAPMVDHYVEFHELPFPVGVAGWEVPQGRTGLGLIPISPTTYLVDRRGRVARMIPGAVPAEAIEDAAARLGWR
jgi:hypothetical protein